jgi:transcriptional regulator with XRE-family HTH domain
MTGKDLREFRLRNKLRRQDMAEFLGCSIPGYVHWERGENAIPSHVKALFVVHAQMVQFLADSMISGLKVDGMARKLGIPRFTLAEAERLAAQKMEAKASRKRKRAK